MKERHFCACCKFYSWMIACVSEKRLKASRPFTHWMRVEYRTGKCKMLACEMFRTKLSRLAVTWAYDESMGKQIPEKLDRTLRREKKWNHPPVIMVLHSPCFPRQRRECFGSSPAYKVGFKAVGTNLAGQIYCNLDIKKWIFKSLFEAFSTSRLVGGRKKKNPNPAPLD